MGQDLWSKPGENTNDMGTGWESPQQYNTNSYDVQTQYSGQNGWNPNNAQAVPNYFADTASESLSTYIGKTYLWMFAGLLLTFGIAFYMYVSGTAVRMLLSGGSAVIIGCTIAELVTVIVMSARIRKISAAGATFGFLLYAALTGVTFSMYFLMFDVTVMIYAFGATALFFGGMAAVSLIFKMQLDSIRPYLFGGLIFLILFGILSAIFNLGAMNTLLCYVGIGIFLAYTAYDTAKVRDNYYYYAGQPELLKKASIFSALALYLDFINLFLRILQIFGKRK